MAVRRPSRVALPESAFVDPEALYVPESVADLESVPGRCYSAESVAFCPLGAAATVCLDCALVELGEDWTNFKTRTNAAIPKDKFYRDLDRAQGEPDPHFRRLMDRRAAFSQSQ